MKFKKKLKFILNIKTSQEGNIQQKNHKSTTIWERNGQNVKMEKSNKNYDIINQKI